MATVDFSSSDPSPVPSMPNPSNPSAAATDEPINNVDRMAHDHDTPPPTSSTTTIITDPSTPGITTASTDRKSRAERPRLASRKPSASILVPSDHPQIEVDEQEFPPDDARAMSPRRNSADVEKLSRDARETLQLQAKRLQSSLAALAERIDEVKSDHDKLEVENRFLQDYIGGLTRTMSSKTEITSSTGAGKARKLK